MKHPVPHSFLTDIVRRVVGVCILIFLLLSPAAAEFAVSPLYGEGAVLQSGREIPVFGVAPPGALVEGWLGEEPATGTADGEGRWELRFAAREPSTDVSDTLELRLKCGGREILSPGLLVGSVWLAAGQSNMAWPLIKSDMNDTPDSERTNPLIRLFRVESEAGPEKLRPDAPIGTWKAANRGTTAYFSAVAFAFASKLQQEKNIPVGIILSAVGGTGIQAWMPVEIFEGDAEYDNTMTFRGPAGFGIGKLSREDYNRALASSETDIELHRGKVGETAMDWSMPDTEVAEWNDIRMPSGQVLSGISWLRASFHLRGGAEAAQPAILDLGTARGIAGAWINGVELARIPVDSAQTLPQADGAEPVQFDVPRDLLLESQNTLAVRVAGIGWMGLIQGEITPPQLRIEGAPPLALAGVWKTRVELDIKRPPPLHVYAGNLFRPAIEPLAPFPLGGIIFYQGESNAYQAEVYGDLFPKLIRSWRELWRQPELPFVFVQLPGYSPKDAPPDSSRWADLRAAQAKALELPATAMAVTIDLGDKDDIHPFRKRAVGERLAALVLGGTRTLGPIAASVRRSGGAVMIDVANGKPPLRPMSPGGNLRGFEIGLQDGSYQAVKAELEGEVVRLALPSTGEPRSVRYAWADWPELGLEDATGLPLAPFELEIAADTNGTINAGAP